MRKKGEHKKRKSRSPCKEGIRSRQRKKGKAQIWRWGKERSLERTPGTEILPPSRKKNLLAREKGSRFQGSGRGKENCPKEVFAHDEKEPTRCLQGTFTECPGRKERKASRSPRTNEQVGDPRLKRRKKRRLIGECLGLSRKKNSFQTSAKKSGGHGNDKGKKNASSSLRKRRVSKAQ